VTATRVLLVTGLAGLWLGTILAVCSLVVVAVGDQRAPLALMMAAAAGCLLGGLVVCVVGAVLHGRGP
jgi:hypothetical protein